MDGWLDRTPRRGRREGGWEKKMEGGGVMQDGGQGVNVCARACVCVRKRQHPLKFLWLGNGPAC